MKLLIAVACISVIALTVYVIGGDYITWMAQSDADMDRQCRQIASESDTVDPSTMTEEEKREALDLAQRCIAWLKS
ncbi:hypothetical protein [Pararhizobium sp. O133]|uniref:hypothetical protein n=1 Tax=Pararhizobium sp. O133 TaxID=3449278 RepID=UPI003F68872A